MTVPPEIAARYDALIEAVEHRDSATLAQIVSDASARKTILGVAKAFLSLQVRIDYTDAQDDNGSVVVTAQYTFDGLQPVPKGKPQPHHSISSVVDTWRQSNGTWHIISEQLAEQTEITD